MLIFFEHQCVYISPWLYWCWRCAHHVDVSALIQAHRGGVALSVHLSSLERSNSATPVTVRALCPLLPFLPSFFLLLLTAASSAVSTGRWPTPRSMSCLSQTSRSTITPARQHPECTSILHVPGHAEIGIHSKWSHAHTRPHLHVHAWVIYAPVFKLLLKYSITWTTFILSKRNLKRDIRGLSNEYHPKKEKILTYLRKKDFGLISKGTTP